MTPEICWDQDCCGMLVEAKDARRTAMDLNLTGKAALVTGGANGVGLIAAPRLAHGGHVVDVDAELDHGADDTGEVAKRPSGKAAACRITSSFCHTAGLPLGPFLNHAASASTPPRA